MAIEQSLAPRLPDVAPDDLRLLEVTQAEAFAPIYVRLGFTAT